MKEFYTRTNANKGIKFPLKTPDGGDTEHWLMILGVDSDEFQRAEHVAKREIGVLQTECKFIEDDTEKEEKFFTGTDQINRDTLASLVSAWSFDKKCTRAEVSKFLKEAPQIANAINTLAGKRMLFHKSAGKHS